MRECLERLVSIGGQFGTIPEVLEKTPDERAAVGVIINDKHQVPLGALRDQWDPPRQEQEKRRLGLLSEGGM